MTKLDEKISEIAKEVDVIELQAMQPSLADAVRFGSKFTEQAVGSFGDGVQNACAMAAGVTWAKAAGWM